MFTAHKKMYCCDAFFHESNDIALSNITKTTLLNIFLWAVKMFLNIFMKTLLFLKGMPL